MTRQIIYVFFGNPRVASERAHESPRVMTMPSDRASLCAIFFSVVLTPAWPWLHGYLTGEPARFDIARLIQPMLFVVACACRGRHRAWRCWCIDVPAKPIRSPRPDSVPSKRHNMWVGRTSTNYELSIAFGRDVRASVRLDGPLCLGRSSACSRRGRPGLWNFQHERSTSAASTPALMKLTAGTRDFGRVMSALALWTNPNLSRRRRHRHARAAPRYAWLV